jgi:hypothetical protein
MVSVSPVTSALALRGSRVLRFAALSVHVNQLFIDTITDVPLSYGTGWRHCTGWRLKHLMSNTNELVVPVPVPEPVPVVCRWDVEVLLVQKKQLSRADCSCSQTPNR